MREGTASRTSEQISQQLEVMAATLNVARGRVGPGGDDLRIVPERSVRSA